MSTDKVKFLESSFTPLQFSYDAVLAEREELKSEIDHWKETSRLLLKLFGLF